MLVSILKLFVHSRVNGYNGGFCIELLCFKLNETFVMFCFQLLIVAIYNLSPLW